MATKNIKVKNCRDCPFSQTDSSDGSGFCAFPGENEVYTLNFDNDAEAPMDCPLRSGSVKISLHYSLIDNSKVTCDILSHNADIIMSGKCGNCGGEEYNQK